MPSLASEAAHKTKPAPIEKPYLVKFALGEAKTVVPDGASLGQKTNPGTFLKPGNNGTCASKASRSLKTPSART